METFTPYIPGILIVIEAIIILVLIRKRANKYVKVVTTTMEKEEEYVDTTVKEVMTPRTSIFAIDQEEKIIDVLDEIIEQGFSRIPVYKESVDDIVGVMYVKDLLKANKEDLVKSHIRKAIYVPETMPINKLLEEFRTKQRHMAIIIDEYGGTSGIVTIEDILEEIVGEIRDEYDVEEDKVRKIAENIYEVQGDTTVEEVNEVIGMQIPISEEYDTISGYVQYQLGKVAEENDQLTEKNFVIRVLEVENKRILKLKIILLYLGGNDNE